MFKNLFLVAVVLFSNTKYLVADAINFLAAISNLLTLILSSADGLACNVFWPHIDIPSLNVAIGFTLPSYKSSRSAWVNLDSTSRADVNIPLLKPSGANHSYATLSLWDITPPATTDGGTHTGLLISLSIILTHGQ